MKLSTQTIDWLIERKDRLRSRENLYRYFWSVNHPIVEITFNWFLKTAIAIGAFDKIGNHYKLKDHKILYHFKKRSDI